MSGRNTTKRRRRIQLAGALCALCIFVIAPLSVCFVHRLWHGYPDGPDWLQRHVDGRVARAIPAQRLISQSIEARILPDTGELHAETVLEVESSGSDIKQVYFLLNPGLKTLSASCEGNPLSVSRQGGLVCVALPGQLRAGERVELELVYSGSVQNTSLASAHINEAEVWLPWPACWHPVDFTSFARFECAVDIPGGLCLAGDVEETPKGNVGWRSYRMSPVQARMGLPLVAGNYSRRSGSYGNIPWEIYFSPGQEASADIYEPVIPSAEAALRTLLGENPGAICAVVSEHVATATYLGNGLAAVPFDAPGGADAATVAVATALAHRWFGDSVSPSWYPSRPDGGAWLLQGLSAYSGWAALRELRGRAAALEFIEKQFPAPLSEPLRTVGAMDLARLSSASAGTLEIDGAFIARWLESTVGREVYWEAVRDVVRVHGGNAVTLDAFRHALELTSEKDLGEFFRVWFDRSGFCDYEVSGVGTDDGKVRISVKNVGDMPALEAITLGIVTAQGLDLHRVEPGVTGGVFVFDVGDAVKGVCLDPYFEMPDVQRANNVWPRREWPTCIAVSLNGECAVGLVKRWESGKAEAIRVSRTAPKGTEYVRLPEPLVEPLLWSPAGDRLAFGTGQTHVWEENKGIKDAFGRRASQPLGWIDERLLARLEISDRARWILAAPPYEAFVTIETLQRPVPGSVACHGDEGVCAFVSETDGKGRVMFSTQKTIECVYEKAGVVGAPAFRGPETLRFLFEEGTVIECSKTPGGWQARKLVELGYPISKGKMSLDGALAAWERPWGHLVFSALDHFEPRHVRLDGDCIDFDWQGSEALICLTRENEWSLPGRFHAVFHVLRVDAVTGEITPLPRFSIQ